MTRKDHIRAADLIRLGKATLSGREVAILTDTFQVFFSADNPRFDPGIFSGYINDTCGPSGGKVKP